jgi:hypothetical protein
MRRIVAGLAVLVVMVIAAGLRAADAPKVTVHEWGTFTTVAGADGHAIDWLPVSGPTDLPCFVNHFQGPLYKVVLDDGTVSLPLTYDQLRSGLRGTVRMETPVLYFYASRDVDMDVTVRFPLGVITEWYPQATVSQPGAYATMLRDGTASTLTWHHVGIRPGSAPTLPTDANASHYYAARDTDASPVRVDVQNEKFLFYRGVGGFQVPVAAAMTDTGKMRVTNLGGAALPFVVVFDNRDGQIGYRVIGALTGETIVDPPVLNGTMAALRQSLEGALVSAGLYAKEAHAMVETWRDSWFEAGTRVFYVLPTQAVDAILPLTVTPAPTSVTRAFVGRMEVITPATMRTVSDALAEVDNATLAEYGRFLGPIADRMLEHASADQRLRIHASADTAYQNYVARLSSHCQ